MKARGALCASVFLACAVVLRAGLPEGYPRGFHRLQVVGPCGYSYGVACLGDRIHYSDFNARSLFRLEANGDSVSVLDGVPGIYGLAAGDGALFYATDGDMNNAAIHRFIPGEPPTTLASGFTRPRQLFFEGLHLKGLPVRSVSNDQVLLTDSLVRPRRLRKRSSTGPTSTPKTNMACRHCGSPPARSSMM